MFAFTFGHVGVFPTFHLLYRSVFILLMLFFCSIWCNNLHLLRWCTYLKLFFWIANNKIKSQSFIVTCTSTVYRVQWKTFSNAALQTNRQDRIQYNRYTVDPSLLCTQVYMCAEMTKMYKNLKKYHYCLTIRHKVTVQ